MVSDRRALDTLTGRSVHPASPALLTKDGPLVTRYSDTGTVKLPAYLTHLKFENSLRTVCPRGL